MRMRTLLAIWIVVLTASVASASPPVKEKHPKGHFFRVAQQNGIWWFVTPSGGRMFSLGADVIDPGGDRKDYHTDHPEYASFRYYPTTAAWAHDTIDRLESWHFNTLGAWSDKAVQNGRLPYTIELELGGSIPQRAPWCDLFSPAIAAKFDEVARKQILPVRDDPHLIGYFTDNELGWWDDTLFLYFLKQGPPSATHEVLIQILRTHYHDDFTRLQRDFDTGTAKSFADLEPGVTMTLRPGGQGMAMVDAFVFRLARRYYKIAHDAIRHYDTHHLILGDRYAGWYPQAVARAAGPYVDVISSNYGADWTDGENAHFYLDTLHRLTGKPVLITEFYFCAMQNRSGNKNSSAGFPTVQTQRQRSAGFRTNLTAFARQPYLIGAHWFQYYDEPAGGRDDGENYNMGMVDTNNRPYEGMTAVTQSLPLATIHRWSRSFLAIDKSVSVPRAGAKPMAGLLGWDKELAYLGTGTAVAPALPFADLYAVWDAGHLYLGIFVMDFAEKKLYPGGKLPPGERMTWTIQRKNQPSLRIQFGTEGKALVSDPHVLVHERSGLKYEVVAALPASYFRKNHLASGDLLPLSVTVTTHSRGRTMQWQTHLRLRGRSSRSAF